MRRGFILGALIACLIFLFSGAAFGQVSGSEHIVRADITVRFDKDGSVSIREELDYVKPRGVAKRGIFRELPLKVKEGDITTEKKFNLTLATRNGKKETVTRQSNPGTLVWRLGRANILLEDGVQKYVLEYNSDDWVVRFDDLDEVRWNVWGEYWPFPLKSLTGRIILPEGASAKQVAAYSGRYGRTENDISITQKGNVIEFKSTKPLAPREAATLAVGVEKGVFDPLSASEARARWWRANGALIGLALLSPAILAFYFLNWSRVGRDPAKPPVFARYAPPKKYSAAAAHRINNKGIDGDAALISTLLSLAIKKWLRIDVTKKETILTRLNITARKTTPLNREEKLLFDLIFKSGQPEIILRKKTPNNRFHQANLIFQSQLNRQYSTEYHRMNMKYIVLGIGLTAIGLVAVLTSFFNALISNLLGPSWRARHPKSAFYVFNACANKKGRKDKFGN